MTKNLTRKRRKIEDIANNNDGIATIEQIRRAGVKDYEVSRLLGNGIVRIKRGVYTCQYSWDEDFDEIKVILATIPNAIVCLKSALYYYGYIKDFEFEIAVPRSLSPSKRNFDLYDVKYYYIQDELHQLGKTYIFYDMPIYDRDKTMCDCFKYHTRFTDEWLETVFEEYLMDRSKDIKKLKEYADKLNLSVAARKKMKRMLDNIYMKIKENDFNIP